MKKEGEHNLIKTEEGTEAYKRPRGKHQLWASFLQKGSNNFSNFYMLCVPTTEKHKLCIHGS
jgi:hypothetical protein